MQISASIFPQCCFHSCHFLLLAAFDCTRHSTSVYRGMLFKDSNTKYVQITCRKGHLIAAGMLYMILYSLPAHKEIRFLIPALQLFIPICAAGLASFLASNYRRKTVVIGITFGTQIIMFLYFGRYHQRLVRVWMLSTIHTTCLTFFHMARRAQIEVMDIINNFQNTAREEVKVLFLTPCHSTPYYSSLHRMIGMRFLDCSPAGTTNWWRQLIYIVFNLCTLCTRVEFRDNVYEINGQERKWLPFPKDGTVSGLSEREYFEKNPPDTLSSMLNRTTSLPDLIVSFSTTSREIEPLLHKNSYTMHKRLSNCLLTFEEDSECIMDIWVLR